MHAAIIIFGTVLNAVRMSVLLRGLAKSESRRKTKSEQNRESDLAVGSIRIETTSNAVTWQTQISWGKLLVAAIGPIAKKQCGYMHWGYLHIIWCEFEGRKNLFTRSNANPDLIRSIGHFLTDAKREYSKMCSIEEANAKSSAPSATLKTFNGV